MPVWDASLTTNYTVWKRLVRLVKFHLHQNSGDYSHHFNCSITLVQLGTSQTISTRDPTRDLKKASGSSGIAAFSDKYHLKGSFLGFSLEVTEWISMDQENHMCKTCVFALKKHNTSSTTQKNSLGLEWKRGWLIDLQKRIHNYNSTKGNGPHPELHSLVNTNHGF